MSRGRKERTPVQLAVLAQAREKAKFVTAERAKISCVAEPPEDPDHRVQGRERKGQCEIQRGVLGKERG